MRFKMFLGNGEVISYSGTRKSQIMLKLKAVPRQNAVKKYWLKVIYGKALDNYGKMETFDNEGEYTTREDLLRTLKIFTERGLLREWLT